ncbi:hypothetical protein SNE40_015554 [Patella caerulea]
MHSDKATTSTSEGRKSSKPIMEKRRRARINASLSELKSLLLEVIKKEGSRHSKMEKADILEMTVKHLRQLQRQQFTGSPKTDSNVLNNYRLGFDECAQEVTRYLSQMEINDVNLRSKILDHLASCVSSGIFNPSPPSTPVSSTTPTPPSHTCGSSPQLQMPAAQISPSPSLVYNPIQQEQLPPHSQVLQTIPPLPGLPAPQAQGQAVQMTNIVSAVQVIPTKLQSGEIAFVMPGNVLNSQAPSYIIPVYPSASATGGSPLAQTVHNTPVSAPNVISSLPIVPTPQHIISPRPSHHVPSATISSEHQFATVTSGPGLTTQSVTPYHPNISLFSPHHPAPQPSHTLPAPLIPLEPRPLFSLRHDQVENDEHVRQDRELPCDDNMWRPW